LAFAHAVIEKANGIVPLAIHLQPPQALLQSIIIITRILYGSVRIIIYKKPMMNARLKRRHIAAAIVGGIVLNFFK
jgi:hypothetical protein